MAEEIAKVKAQDLGSSNCEDKGKPQMGAISASEETPISPKTKKAKSAKETVMEQSSAEAWNKAVQKIEQPKQSTASGGHEQTATSVSSSSSSAAKADPSKQANQEPTDAKNLLKMFGPTKTDDLVVKNDSTKMSFLQADLIFPGIALKKVKQAMTSENATPQNYIAALGEMEVQMHRTKRTAVSGMVLADIMQFRDSFWQRVSTHLHGQKIAAFLLASNNPLSTEDVSWLT